MNTRSKSRFDRLIAEAVHEIGADPQRAAQGLLFHVSNTILVFGEAPTSTTL